MGNKKICCCCCCCSCCKISPKRLIYFLMRSSFLLHLQAEGFASFVRFTILQIREFLQLFYFFPELINLSLNLFLASLVAFHLFCSVPRILNQGFLACLESVQGHIVLLSFNSNKDSAVRQ